jgi:hypothetical protein
LQGNHGSGWPSQAALIPRLRAPMGHVWATPGAPSERAGTLDPMSETLEQAFEELDAQGHLDPASRLGFRFGRYGLGRVCGCSRSTLGRSTSTLRLARGSRHGSTTSSRSTSAVIRCRQRSSAWCTSAAMPGEATRRGEASAGSRRSCPPSSSGLPLRLGLGAGSSASRSSSVDVELELGSTFASACPRSAGPPLGATIVRWRSST